MLVRERQLRWPLVDNELLQPERVTASVLVFRAGSIGDTLVAVPALRAVRAHFHSAHITLLCDRQIGRSYVLASDLLADSGLVDSFIEYPFDRSSGRATQLFRMARLLLELRRRRFDALVYLAPSNRAATAGRDRQFFAAAGIRDLYGFDGFLTVPANRPATGFAEVPREADLLLARLAKSQIGVPAPGSADPRLPTGQKSENEFALWRRSLDPDGGRRLIGVGPGCNQPVNRWPLERYTEVVKTLIDRHDVWPVIFGGAEDAEDARQIVAAAGRGHIAAGALTIGATICAMRSCVLHVGNDTGTMHMAAAAGIRCVGIYSSRNLPGLWFPYGREHLILRTPITCENCELVECVDRGMACLLAITTEQVIDACSRMLTAPDYEQVTPAR